MTQTIQSCSIVYLNEAGNDLTVNNPESEDNISLLLSLFDSLNTLCETLSKLDYEIQRKNMENILFYQRSVPNDK